MRAPSMLKFFIEIFPEKRERKLILIRIDPAKNNVSPEAGTKATSVSEISLKPTKVASETENRELSFFENAVVVFSI